MANPTGRPAWIPTKEILDKAEEYGELGMTKQQIADALGIAYQTLNEKTKEFEDFSEAIKRGQAKGIANVASMLKESVDNGSVPAQIFYLKARAKWSDQNLEEVQTAIKNELDEVRDMVQKCMQPKS